MKGWLIAALVVLGAYTAWQRRAVRQAHDGRVAAEATANALGRIADSIARERQRAVEVYRPARDRWHIVVDSVTDSIPVPVEVIVRVADSAIAACDRALNACTAEVGVLREARDSLLSAVKLRDREARGCRVLGLLPCPEVVAGYGVTAGLDGRVTHGPGVLVGVRIW